MYLGDSLLTEGHRGNGAKSGLLFNETTAHTWMKTLNCSPVVTRAAGVLHWCCVGLLSRGTRVHIPKEDKQGAGEGQGGSGVGKD